MIEGGEDIPHFGVALALVAGVTVIWRVFPVLLMHQAKLPQFVENFLAVMPITLMVCIITSELIGQASVSLVGLYIALSSVLIGGILGYVFTSLFLPVIVGMLVFWLGHTIWVL